jgi:hypothetical protein
VVVGGFHLLDIVAMMSIMTLIGGLADPTTTAIGFDGELAVVLAANGTQWGRRIWIEMVGGYGWERGGDFAFVDGRPTAPFFHFFSFERRGLSFFSTARSSSKASTGNSNME